jgi:hypothetical protein
LSAADLDVGLAQETLHHLIAIMIFDEHVFSASGIWTLNGKDHDWFSSADGEL